MAGRIERVELFPARLPYGRKMTWASSSESAADFMVLRLTTSDGVCGVSEGVVKTAWTGATPRMVLTAFEEIFTPMLLGLDPADDAALNKIAKVRENNLCKAMIDVAVWDLRACLAMFRSGACGAAVRGWNCHGASRASRPPTWRVRPKA